MSNSQALQRKFFGSSAYAVAGASANTQKFGYRLLAWYNDRSIPVTPITPSSDEILGLRCVKSIDELQGRGKGVSLSVVTPPQATKSILEQAAEQKNLEGIWLQPGAEDGAVLDLIDNNDWLRERTVHSGPCVLVAGDRLRREVAEKL